MRRSLPDADRRRIVRQLPPKRCSAKANRTGEACRKFAVLGADVCATHGGRAPQVKARAAERITLAQALAADDRRHPWAVMEDALGVADVLMRAAKDELATGGSATVGQIEKAVAALERAHRLARSNVDAGLAERKQRFAEAQAAAMARFVELVLGDLGLTADQRRAVPGVIARRVRELRGGMVEGEVVVDAR